MFDQSILPAIVGIMFRSILAACLNVLRAMTIWI